MSDAVCHQCGKPLPSTTRRHARFCSPAHRAAYHRSSTARRMARVRFSVARTRDKTAGAAYIGIVPDHRFLGVYRLKRTDGTLSDMVNLTRAKDALTRHKRRSTPTACRHDLSVVRRVGGAAMTEFAIVVTELSGNKTELCRVGSNPEAVAEAARRKTARLGRSRRMPLYTRVEVKP